MSYKKSFLITFTAFLLAACLSQIIAAESESREWETADGKFKVTAKYKEFNEKESKVVLIRKDGKEISVPVAKLSQNDQDYIKRIAGNKKSDVDSFGQEENPKSNEVKKSSEKQSGEGDAGKVVASTPEINESLAQQLADQFKQSIKPIKQPTWSKVWSLNSSIPFRDFSFTRDGKFMVDVTAAGECEIRDLSDGKVIKTGEESLLGKSLHAAISPDGKYILTATESNGVIVWDRESGEKKFVHEAPQGKAQQVAISHTGDIAAILDEKGAVHTYPLLGGRGSVMDAPDDPKNATPNRFSLSPDGKKASVWRSGGSSCRNANFSIGGLLSPKNTLTTNLNPGYSFIGGICTNHYFCPMNNNGVIVGRGVVIDQFFTMHPISADTPFSRMGPIGVNSWDGKHAAFYNPMGIVVFPASNPNLSRLICMPKGMFIAMSMNPDLGHMLTIDVKRNITYWKLDNVTWLDQVKDIPLLRELTAKHDFATLDRAYMLLDKDPEVRKFTLVYSATMRFLEQFEIALRDVPGVTREKNELALLHSDHSSNTLVRIRFAKEATAKAWQARGGGRAGSVTEAGWKSFGEKMGEAKKLLEPIMKSDHISSDVFYEWLRVCQGTGWEKDDVELGITRLVKDYPTNAAAHCFVAFSMLPRWHGESGDTEKYCERISDVAGEEYKDAIYTASIKSIVRKKNFLVDARILFDAEKNPPLTQDEAKIDWERVSRGAEQLAKIFPEDSYGATLGLKYCVMNNNFDGAKKFLDMLDEKHQGVLSPWCLDYAELASIRGAIRFGQKANAPATE